MTYWIWQKFKSVEAWHYSLSTFILYSGEILVPFYLFKGSILSTSEMILELSCFFWWKHAQFLRTDYWFWGVELKKKMTETFFLLFVRFAELFKLSD